MIISQTWHSNTRRGHRRKKYSVRGLAFGNTSETSTRSSRCFAPTHLHICIKTFFCTIISRLGVFTMGFGVGEHLTTKNLAWLLHPPTVDYSTASSNGAHLWCLGTRCCTFQALNWMGARTLQEEDRTRVDLATQFLRDPRIHNAHVHFSGDLTSGGSQDEPNRSTRTRKNAGFGVPPTSLGMCPPCRGRFVLSSPLPRERQHRSQPSDGGATDIFMVSAGGFLLREQEGPAQP